MNKFISEFKECAFLNGVRYFLTSKLYPYVTALLTLLCYYLGWDLVIIYYIGITGTLILILLDDITPTLCNLLFMGVMISLKNTPSDTMGNSDYYFRTANMAQIFTIISIYICGMIYKIVKTAVDGRFRFTPAFFGLCAFAATLLMNGIFSKDYNPKNLLYGLIMASSFLCIFSAIKDNLNLTTGRYASIAHYFFVFSLLLLVELIVAYATTEGLFANGTVQRGLLIFGWGVYNNYGAYLIMCVPAIIYLAGKTKYGFAYTLYSVFVFVALFFCCSRQAMVGAAIVYPVCAVVLLVKVKGKDRIANLCIFGAAIVAGIILIGIYHNTVFRFFKDIFANIYVNGELSGSGRTKLWREAFEYFRDNPFFGSGFYVKFSYKGNTGLGFMPPMCHNTLLQLLSSCGLIGFTAYLVHRTQTVLSFFSNITTERAFIAMTIIALLIVSLLDNHMFNIFPTLIYSNLIAVFVQNEKRAVAMQPLKA